MASKKFKYEYKIEVFKPERYQVERGKVEVENIEQAINKVNRWAADLYITLDRSGREVEELRWEFTSIGQGHYMNKEQAYNLLGYEKCPECKGFGEVRDWHNNEDEECSFCEGTGYDHPGHHSADFLTADYI